MRSHSWKRRKRPGTTRTRFSEQRTGPLASKRTHNLRDSASVRFQRATYRRRRASEYRSLQECYLRHRLKLLDWLDDMSALVGAVEPVEHTTEYMEFRLSRLNPDIRIFVTAVAIGVVIYRNGEWFDLLVDIDVAPERIVGGWLNNFRLPEWQRVFRDLDSLWHTEVFNPFRQWVRMRLLPARVLVISAMHNGATWTKFADTTTPVDPHEIARPSVWIDSQPDAEFAGASH